MDNKKILIGYVVTTDVWQSFNSAQHFQKKLIDLAGYNRVIVSDSPRSMEGFSSIVCPRLKTDDGMSLNAGYNDLIEYAVDNNFEALVTLDADMLLMEHPRLPPENYFTCCRIFWSTLDEISTEHFRFWDSERWTSSSAFIMHRNDFLKRRYCEGFLGHGFNDIDFFENVLVATGAKPFEWTTNAIHYWHPVRSNEKNEVNTANNRLLYEKRKKERQSE